MLPAHAQAALKPFWGHLVDCLQRNAGTPMVHSWSKCRRRWSMTSASTVWTHGLWVLCCRVGEAATPSPLGTVPGTANAHMGGEARCEGDTGGLSARGGGRRSTVPRQETRRGTNRVERPYRRPAQVPRAVRAPHRQGGGGGGTYSAGARAQTYNGQPSPYSLNMVNFPFSDFFSFSPHFILVHRPAGCSGNHLASGAKQGSALHPDVPGQCPGRNKNRFIYYLFYILLIALDFGSP